MSEFASHPLAAGDAAFARRLARGFAGLTALTLSLIVLGALVRAHGAGLACPDWPLCFGELVPSFDLKIRFEWTHRLAAGSIGLLFAGLAVAALRRAATRRALLPLLAAAAFALGIQVVLGALTVWQLLASWTVTAHLLTGNGFCAALLLCAQRLRDLAEPPPTPPSAPTPLRALMTATGVLLVLQIALGGLVASTFVGLVCPEWPTCANGEWFPSFEGARGLHLLHRLNGYALVAGLLGCAWLGRRHPALRRILWATAALALAQVAVGVADVLLRIPVEVTGLHTGLAATLVLLVTHGLREVWRQAPPTGATQRSQPSRTHVPPST